MGAIGGSIIRQKIMFANHTSRPETIATKHENPLQSEKLSLLTRSQRSHYEKYLVRPDQSESV